MSDVVSISCDGEGGEQGGVSSWRDPGRGPGEQNGMCLFGTAAGVPRCEVLMLSCGGGVAVRAGKVAGLVAQTVALILHQYTALLFVVVESWLRATTELLHMSSRSFQSIERR